MIVGNILRETASSVEFIDHLSSSEMRVPFVSLFGETKVFNDGE
jgi:hypothetical protein